MSADQSDHWAARFIGMPSPDCWAFVRQIWAEHWQIIVPQMPYDPSDPRQVRRALEGAPAQGWQPIVHPVEGCGAMMTRGLRPCHIGIWIEPDDVPGVLHWVEGSGGVFTPVMHLGAMGYGVQGFWRHADLMPAGQSGAVP